MVFPTRPGHTSVCVSVMSSGDEVVDHSVTVANPDPTQLPDVEHVPEVGPAPAERMPLRLDRFSATCHTADAGTLTRVANANFAGQWVALHAHQTAETLTPGQGPGDPGEPCAEGGPTVTGPLNSVQVTVERNSGDPVALCMRATTLSGSGPTFAVTVALDRTPSMPTIDAGWRPDTT